MGGEMRTRTASRNLFGRASAPSSQRRSSAPAAPSEVKRGGSGSGGHKTDHFPRNRRRASLRLARGPLHSGLDFASSRFTRMSVSRDLALRQWLIQIHS
jgi:hypothetical protein